MFICLGIYPDNHVLEDGSDIDQLVDYLENGGRLYLEGGDTWARDDPTDLHPYFATIGEADGQDDLSSIAGHGCLKGHQFEYASSQAYIDHLAPQEGASLFFSNENPAYGAGVGYDNGLYRTIAVSFEFGGLADGSSTKDNLLGDILDFFDNGCSTKGPPPMNVQAFSGYDSAVPLMWDAPPGQMTLSHGKALALSLNFSRSRANTITTKAADAGEPALMKTNAASGGYQTGSYNVYRSTSPGGAYDKIAAHIDRQYYRDTTVDNATTYYYVLTSNYDTGESDFSVVASAASAENGHVAKSVWKDENLTIDGFIDDSEWSGATKIDVRNNGQAEPVYLYLLNNDDYLYIGLDDAANTLAEIDDQVGIYIDADRDGEWSNDVFLEGNFWFPWNGSESFELYRELEGWWPEQIEWDDPYANGHATSATSTISGHLQYEIRYALHDIELLPGETVPINLFLYELDMPDSLYRAAWPTPVLNNARSTAWLAPVLYGTVELSGEVDCSSITDSESVSAPGQYTFNENGDGHQVDINVTSLSGSGDIAVRQYNCVHPNLPGADPLSLYWVIEIDATVTEMQANYRFHYTENDATGFEETVAWWGVAWFNESNKTWTWLGGDIDADNNDVTVSDISRSGTFVLHRRIYGDVTADGYVDLDDYQLFGDVWNQTAESEFPPGSNARFFNYSKNTDDDGHQIIDLDDFQIFGDVWNNGIE